MKAKGIKAPANASGAAHLSLGRQGEEAAIAFLCRQHWKILARNWRPKDISAKVELDCVAKNGRELVFVEVKTRQRKSNGDAIPTYAAFTVQKQKNIVHAARLFLAEQGLGEMPCRFDLVCVEYFPDGNMELEHYKDVIRLGNLMDSGNATRQLW